MAIQFLDQLEESRRVEENFLLPETCYLTCSKSQSPLNELQISKQSESLLVLLTSLKIGSFLPYFLFPIYIGLLAVPRKCHTHSHLRGFTVSFFSLECLSHWVFSLSCLMSPTWVFPSAPLLKNDVSNISPNYHLKFHSILQYYCSFFHLEYFFTWHLSPYGTLYHLLIYIIYYLCIPSRVRSPWGQRFLCLLLPLHVIPKMVPGIGRA